MDQKRHTRKRGVKDIPMVLGRSDGKVGAAISGIEKWLQEEQVWQSKDQVFSFGYFEFEVSIRYTSGDGKQMLYTGV